MESIPDWTRICPHVYPSEFAYRSLYLTSSRLREIFHLYGMIGECNPRIRLAPEGFRRHYIIAIIDNLQDHLKNDRIVFVMLIE